MRKYFACLILLASSPVLAATLPQSQIAYYPSEFYRRIEIGEDRAQLRQELFEILSSFHVTQAGSHDVIFATCPTGQTCWRHTSLGYTPARRALFGELHLLQTNDGYAVLDLYCQRLVSQRAGPGQIPDSRLMNAEHTWPQSRFSSRFPRDLQKSDLHILFPVDSRANSSRSNIEFGDVVTTTSSPCPGARRGYTARGGGQYFEVPASHKGNVARAVFYFAVRYNLPIRPLEEDSLRTWHRIDPVDADEISRNAKIFAKQKVRNPFIDHPELVELISDF